MKISHCEIFSLKYMLILLIEIKNYGEGLFIMGNRKQNTRMTEHFQRSSATEDMCIQPCNTERRGPLTQASLLHRTPSRLPSRCTPQRCGVTGWWPRRFQSAHASLPVHAALPLCEAECLTEQSQTDRFKSDRKARRGPSGLNPKGLRTADKTIKSNPH